MFSTKTAIVTGGTGVIGRAICLELLNNGCNVIAVDLAETSEFLDLKNRHKNKDCVLTFAAGDVTDINDLERVFNDCIKTFGSIDILCGNAGIAGENRWKQIIEVNIIGVVHTIQLGIKYMSKANGYSGGSIVITGSIASYINIAESPVYCASKHAVLGLIRSYATGQQIAQSGISLNMVCPPAILSPIFDAVVSEMVEKTGETAMTLDPVYIGRAVVELVSKPKNGRIVMVEVDGSLEDPHHFTLDEWLLRNRTKF